MADYKSTVIVSGKTKQIADADTLLVGAGIKSSTGSLVLSATGSDITVATGKTLGTTGTGNINLPNNGSARFQIEASSVSANVTAANLGTLTASTTSNADALHTHSFNKLTAASINTGVTVTGDTSEHNLISVSIPGGTLSTTNAVRVKLFGKVTATVNTKTVTYRLKYGATTVATIVQTITLTTSASAAFDFVLDADLISQGNANSQTGFMTLLFSDTAPTTGFIPKTGTATEASAGALNLVISAQLNDATLSIGMVNTLVEQIKS